MKVFRKTALLISVIVLAVVLAVGAVAGAALLSEGNATLGEEYSAVQVTTDGKVNLKVYYSNLGSAEKFIAEVVDPVTEEVDTYTYTVAELGEATANGYCVKVPLAPSQMTHTVRVWAAAGDTKSEVREFTVADYANDVLAKESLSDYHDAMRALLNWGAMAQTKYGDATSVKANVDLFERGSNSIYGVNTITYEAGSVTPGSTITGNTMNLSLDPGNIVLHFYVNYTGSGTLTATVSKDGGEAVDTDITNTADGWHVTVANVPATMFDTPYTVTVTDGTDTFTATKTIREYLGTLLAQCNDKGDTATGNTVRALYQFYQILTGKTGAADCAHNQKYYYWVADGSGTTSVRCNQCHTVLGTGISNDVNAYAHAGTLQNVGVTGQVDKTLKTEDGVQFVRYDNAYTNRDNWGDISLSSVFTGVEGVTGQYMVIKYRTSAEGNSKTTLETYSNTNKGSEKNLTGNGLANIVASKDDQWHTVIINLAERVKDPSITFVDEGDGTYNVRYLSIRAFAGGSTVTDDTAEGRYAYVYSYTKTSGETAYETYYGVALTDEALAAKVETYSDYALYQIKKQSVTADAYLDLAYVALCDSEAEAKSLIDTAVYEKSTANDKSLYLNTADDSCVHAWDGKETVQGNTYSYNCFGCGETLYSKTVPESVAVFISPYTISAPVAKAENNKITPNTHFEMTEKASAFDGIPYYGFNGTGNTKYGKTSQLIWMRSAQDVGSASDHERRYIDIDQSKYIVIKARGNAGALTDLNFVFSTSGYKGTKSVNLPLSAAGADEWGVYVVDLSKVLSTYYVKNTETDTYELDTFYFNVLPFETTDRVELGYVAFVEDWAGVDAIVDETTFYNVTDTAGAYVELNTADHTCLGAHTETVQVIDGVYKTACSVCGTVVRDHGVKADAVGLYWSAEELYRRSTATTQTSSTEGAYWTGGPVNQYLLTEDGETFLRISDMETNGTWGGWFPVNSGGGYAHPGSGRYMVIKVRQNDNSLNYSRIGFYVTSAGSSNTWDKGGFSVYLPEDNQWHVIVVDLAEKASGYTTDANGDYGIKTVHLRPFGGGSNMDTVTDEIMDIAYMAFFNNLADLKNIIAEDSFEMSQSASSSLVLDTDTLECVIHTADLTSDAQTRVEGENTTYYYTCSACGGECYAKTVPTTSAYLGPKYATQAVTYYNTTKSGLAIADGNVVGRVTGKTTDASQVIWLRNENDMATNQYTSVAENQTVNIGKAKYLIIKVQVNGAELTAWDVTFSTTGYNRVLSEQTTPMVRNKSYYYVDAEGTEHTLLTADVDAGTVSPEEGWTQKMVNVVSKTGMQSFKLPTAAVEQGEWVVFAIDLQTVLSTSFVADESGDYIIDSFYTTFNGLAAGATMDYAYFAYAEDWQGVDDIVDEATLIEVTDTAGSYNVVNVADHSTVAE